MRNSHAAVRKGDAMASELTTVTSRLGPSGSGMERMNKRSATAIAAATTNIAMAIPPALNRAMTDPANPARIAP